MNKNEKVIKGLETLKEKEFVTEFEKQSLDKEEILILSTAIETLRKIDVEKIKYLIWAKADYLQVKDVDTLALDLVNYLLENKGGSNSQDCVDQILSLTEADKFSECEKVAQEMQQRINKDYTANTLLLGEDEIVDILWNNLPKSWFVDLDFEDEEHRKINKIKRIKEHLAIVAHALAHKIEKIPEKELVDTSKIKVGDKVWVEYEVYGDDDPISGIHFRSKSSRLMDNVVAHFPHPKDKAEVCEQKTCMCMDCGQVMKVNEQSKHFKECKKDHWLKPVPPKPSTSGIEELGAFRPLEYKMMWDKIDELVRAYKLIWEYGGGKAPDEWTKEN